MRDPRACVGGHSDKAIRARPISDTSHRGGSFSKSTDVSTRIPGEMEEKMREMIHQNAGLSMRIRSMGSTVFSFIRRRSPAGREFLKRVPSAWIRAAGLG